MERNEQIYQGFLEVLRELRDFQERHGLVSPGIAENPDFARLLEALAFFYARIMAAAQYNVESTRLRMFRQFFPYLVDPLPSMAMVVARPTGQLADALELPAGTELALLPDSGGSVLFRTLQPLRILAMELASARRELGASGGTRLLLKFQAFYDLNEEIGNLSLHIDYVNDFERSLQILHFLEHHLYRASVQFGEYSGEGPSDDCGFSFGRTPWSIDDRESEHPLAYERGYFHFPRQEFYLHCNVPYPPRNWRTFTLLLDCKAAWPALLSFHRDLFRLYTVPVSNAIRAYAEPVAFDGLRESYPIRHPHPEQGFSVQKILGVYELTKSGAVPMTPGILSAESDSYEIDRGPLQADGSALCSLLPRFAADQQRPRTLAVEALWFQPWFDEILDVSHRFQPFRRVIGGVEWQLMDIPTAHAGSRDLDNTIEYLKLLTLMNQPTFSITDIRLLLGALGTVLPGRFGALAAAMKALRLEEEPLSGTVKEVMRRIYTITFDATHRDQPFLLEPFIRHLETTLDCWIADDLVEVHPDFAGRGAP